MKRITIYIAHLLVLVLTGCDKTVLEFPENEGVDPTLVNANLSLAIDPKNRTLRADRTLRRGGY